MKQCPNCKTIYTDESLRFCLADGASLVSLPNTDETSASFDKNTPSGSADSFPTVFSPVNPPVRKKRAGLFIVAALIGFLLLAVIVLAASVSYFLLRRGENKPNVANVSPAPASTISPSPKSATIDETANLKEKPANLERQVQIEKNQKRIAPERGSPIQSPTGNTARVNSPNDGFLALRSEPNSETGERLAKIPHGASVTVLGCPKPSNVGKMPGHWCQIVYNGQTGWAFDAFLIR